MSPLILFKSIETGGFGPEQKLIRLLNAQPGLESLNRGTLQQLVSFTPPLTTLSEHGEIPPSIPWSESNVIYGKGANSSPNRPQVVRQPDKCTPTECLTCNKPPFCPQGVPGAIEDR